MKVLVINGPNINMLGIREKFIYGENSYEDLKKSISDWADELNLEVEIFQSNHEGSIVDKIQEAYNSADGIIINAGAYTHTSIAILDALKAVNLPTVEVHISDVTKRESFRQISYIREVCIKSICGEGFEGYKMAMECIKDVITKC